MNLLLKIYFWFLLAASVLGYVINFDLYQFNYGVLVLLTVDLILSGIVTYAFYSMLYGSPLPYRKYLKYFMPLFLVWEIAIFYFFQVQVQRTPSTLIVILLSWLIFLPEYVLVTRQAFRNTALTQIEAV